MATLRHWLHGRHRYIPHNVPRFYTDAAHVSCLLCLEQMGLLVRLENLTSHQQWMRRQGPGAEVLHFALCHPKDRLASVDLSTYVLDYLMAVDTTDSGG